MASKILNDVIVKESKINDKQKQFCKEYVKNLNALQSYRRVYGENLDDSTCKVNGCKLLTNANIKKYINNIINSFTDDIDVTVAEIVSNMKKIALDEDARNSDKLKAWELLAKYKNMFVEHKEITTNDITVTLLDEEDINTQLLQLGYDASKETI